MKKLKGIQNKKTIFVAIILLIIGIAITVIFTNANIMASSSVPKCVSCGKTEYMNKEVPHIDYHIYTCSQCHETDGSNTITTGKHIYSKGICTVCDYEHPDWDHVYLNGVCKVCEYSHKDHTYENGKCIVCGYGHSHTHTYKETVIPPTCSEMGYTQVECTICGDSYKQFYVEKNETAHTYENGNCTGCGYTHTEHTYEHGVCTVCKHHKSNVPECDWCGKKEYMYYVSSNSNGTHHYYACSNCQDENGDDAKFAELHTYSNGTCSICGYTCSSHTGGTHNNDGKCTICDYQYQKHGKNIDKPTYYSDSEHHYSAYACYFSECNMVYYYKSTAEPHIYSDGKCTVCEYSHKDHTYENGKCTVCDYEHTSHTYGNWTTTKQATCKATGSRKRICSVCNKEEIGTIQKTAHTYGEWTTTKEAKCEETGGKKRACTVCGTEETETIPATGHTEVTIPAVEATCKTEGKTAGKKCSVCDEIIEAQQTIQKTGHSYGEWTTTKEAKCEEAGSKKRVCSVCNEEETGTIPATGHTETKIPAVEATCKTEGKTAGKNAQYVMR